METPSRLSTWRHYGPGCLEVAVLNRATAADLGFSEMKSDPIRGTEYRLMLHLSSG